MNKTEAAYAGRLRILEGAGEIRDFVFEGEQIELAPGCVYTPDFVVEMPDGSIEYHEVKGYERRGSPVRFKVAATKRPGCRFVMVRRRPSRERRKLGEWAVIRELNGKKGGRKR